MKKFKMRKFLSVVTSITILSLLYVYQQAALVQRSYQINDNAARLCLLIDRNESLRYNVASIKTPDNLNTRLALNNIELDTPKNWHSIRLANVETPAGPAETAKGLTYESSFKIAGRVLLDIFAPRAEAIAQELNQP